MRNSLFNKTYQPFSPAFVKALLVFFVFASCTPNHKSSNESKQSNLDSTVRFQTELFVQNDDHAKSVTQVADTFFRLAELMNLRSENLANVEGFCTKKGWQFFNAKHPDDTAFGEMIFTLNKHSYDDRAEAIFKYFYKTEQPLENQIFLGIENAQVYAKLIEEATDLELPLKYTDIVGNEFVKVYENDTAVIFFISKKSDRGASSKTEYHIQIVHPSIFPN